MSAGSADQSFISAGQMKQILEVTRALAVVTELDPLLEKIAQACCAMLGCERSSIFLHDPQTDQLWTKVALGSKEIRVPSHAGIVGHVFKTNQVFHCPRPYEEPRFNPEPDRKSGFVTRNILAAPMVDLERRAVGVIQAINKQADAFTESDLTLIQLLSDQAGVAVQRFRLQQAAIEGVALRREMDLAKIVQEAMIPDEPPTIAGLESIGWTKSASITGGDSFDLWKTTDGALGIFLGDASGHGIAPALVVAQARTLVRTLCEIIADPDELLARVNARLIDDLETGRFVTAFYGLLKSDGHLRWSSAGHGPILVRTDPESPLRQLVPPSPPLGIIPEFFTDPAEQVVINPGGCLIVASDGIIEAPNAADELFGTLRLIAILDEHRNDSLDRQSNEIRRAVHLWQGNDDPKDDQTLVVARRTV